LRRASTSGTSRTRGSPSRWVLCSD
jgi:hypothetical protein